MDVLRAGTDTYLVAMGELTMNKFSPVPRRLPSIMKHKVSMQRPVCMHQITFHQTAELFLIRMGKWTEEDRLLINVLSQSPCPESTDNWSS